MAKTGFRIDGLKELDARLKDIGRNVQRNVLKQSLSEGADLIAADAARRAPRSAVPRRPDAGHLADNIVTSVRAKGPGASALIGPSKKHFWGVFLEFGTPKAAPHPFLRPAFDENARKALDIIIDRLRSELEKRGV